MYPNVCRIWKSITYNTARAAFGFEGSSNVGQSAFPAIQAAPSFPSSFPIPLSKTPRSDHMACLIPCAIDQDPYFRVTRDIAHKIAPKTHPLRGKPALVHSKFFPPLQGALGKMSASARAASRETFAGIVAPPWRTTSPGSRRRRGRWFDGAADRVLTARGRSAPSRRHRDPLDRRGAAGNTDSAIFLTDSDDEIKRKITTHAFSGGRETAKLQRELGADLELDVSFQWLRFFLEDDDELALIEREYGSGTGEYWNTAAVKTRLIVELQKLVQEHKKRRDVLTDADVDKWMAVRALAPAA